MIIQLINNEDANISFDAAGYNLEVSLLNALEQLGWNVNIVEENGGKENEKY